MTIGTLQGKLVSRTDANMLVELVPETLAPKPMFTYTDINPAFKVMAPHTALCNDTMLLIATLLCNKTNMNHG